MRLLAIAVRNVGGLRDLDIQLPDHPVVAFAGANGTGKSKLLAAVLAPWTQTLPAPASEGLRSEVSLQLVFEAQELDALAQLDAESQWNHGRPAPAVTVTCSFSPMGGFRMELSPDSLAVRHGFSNQALLRRAPSLNLVYLPAERRLLPPNSSVLDLSQLAAEMGLAKVAEARVASTNFGRLDDQEFESYAKALCVAGSLPSEDASDSESEAAKRTWSEFKSAVDDLLHPKVLLGLTRQNPTDLLVQLPTGERHKVQELSSGERQALVIISRVFRAGEGHSVVAIDEPDAHLHPTLSSRLLAALRLGLGHKGRLLLATHSPSILDALPAEAIFRLSHDSGAAVVESEAERLRLYREAGFRASALTQADRLLVTEGELDAVLLPQLAPGLSSAAIRSAGGREQVLRSLVTLAPYDLPVYGVIDRDVHADKPDRNVADRCHMWSCADIEGVLLSDDSFLTEAVAGRLVRTEYADVEALRELLANLVEEFHEAAVAEMAQRELRRRTNITWPSPRGDEPLKRLRQVATALPELSAEQVEEVIAEAATTWTTNATARWQLVRGKWLLPRFLQQATHFRSGEAFLLAVSARRPAVSEVAGLATAVAALGSAVA